MRLHLRQLRSVPSHGLGRANDATRMAESDTTLDGDSLLPRTPEPSVIATTDDRPKEEREPPVTGGDADDERTCRICFASGDDEDGRLIAPCRCSGTVRTPASGVRVPTLTISLLPIRCRNLRILHKQARYVHQGCLRSWREADRKNSFYACTQCGEKYRFRSSGIASFLGHRCKLPFLCLAGATTPS